MLGVSTSDKSLGGESNFHSKTMFTSLYAYALPECTRFSYLFCRPVVALIEVDIYRVSKEKRSKIRDEVATSLGPPDPTVLVQEKEEGVSVSIPQLLETFRKFGDVVLVRVTDDAILVTFKKSTSAVTATSVKEVGTHTPNHMPMVFHLSIIARICYIV